MSPDPDLFGFVRGLLGGEVAVRSGEVYRLCSGRRARAATIDELIGRGALAGDDRHCRANGETRAWLRRHLLDPDGFGGQHRHLAASRDAPQVNLAESPLSRLANGAGAFLGRHHLEAGERVRRLVERAQLRPRLTMSYAAASAQAGTTFGRQEVSDLAADARRAVDEIHRVLPADCAGAVIDVCGFLKGLQEVERERGWPRRSAKLVLRIGLEQLAQHYGIGAVAVGAQRGRLQRWMDAGARPDRFA